MRQIAAMLCAGLVHADLSEFNILAAADGPMIIDLPQAVDAARNNNAKRLLLRDVANITRFFARFAPELRRTQYGEEMWLLYEHATLRPDSPLTGKLPGRPRRRSTPRSCWRPSRTPSVMRRSAKR
jgi:RIO kinase 1